ncbi:MAG: pilus assembly protein CpaE [Acidimicrobiia bacterium]|jgi:hypothetical protein
MISVDLALELREVGLAWVPANGDRFQIPDRGMDHHIFSISEMTVGVDDSPGGRQIRFNGAVEWALDSIQQKEVVWLPSETQLRNRLGGSFRSLTVEGGKYVCVVAFGEEVASYRASTPEDAYGKALLDLLEDPGRHMSTILGEV